MYNTQKSVRGKQGFTIMELLVVIAIIGIFASIVLASLNSSRQKSRDARRIADIDQIQAALEVYFNENSKYPVKITALAPNLFSAIPTDPSQKTPCIVGQESNAPCYRYASLCVSPANLAPVSYHLGTSLEQHNYKVLDSDADAAQNATGNNCTGSTDFNANDEDASPCRSTDAGRYCYDVTP